MSEMGQDRPIFAPARSRSQGPLSDQVADAPNPRGQCRSWVEPGGSIVVTPTAGIGAQQPFSRGGARVSNAPIPAVRGATTDRLKSTLKRPSCPHRQIVA